MAHIDTPHLHLDILTLHAPTRTNYNHHAINEFFADITRIINMRKDPNRQLIIMGDFNSKLGSMSSASVGNHRPETQCGNGHLMHSLLFNNQLAAPSTFPLHKEKLPLGVIPPGTPETESTTSVYLCN